jgi:putative ABC transport system permease protein
MYIESLRRKFMRTLWQDLRYSARMLLKKPGFTAIAVITLALGIGANTAIFSVVNRVLLFRLQYKDAGRLVMAWGSNPQQGLDIDTVSPADLADWRAQNTVFEDLAATTDAQYNLTGMGEPELLIGYSLAANFFQVAGVQPALGHVFTPEEDRAGAPGVVILSHRLWQWRFGSDPKAIGRSVTLNGNPYTIIGVMPAGFQFPQRSELWTPLKLNSLSANQANNRNFRYLRVMARLKPGGTLEQAQMEMSRIAQRLAEQHPDTNAGEGVKIVSLQEQYAGDIKPTLLALLGAVGFTLLIACVNVANLLLAQAAARQREIAVRTALGAWRGRIVRQLLTESVLLALIGGALGLLLTVWSANLLVALFPNEVANLNIPVVEEIPIDGRVLGFSLLISLLTGVIFGLAPAWQASKPDLSQSLKESGANTTAGVSRRRMRGLLVVSEMALAVLLLVGAGLMIKSFWRLLQGDLGLNPKNVLTMEVLLSPQKYSDGRQRRTFLQGVMQRIENLPGVEQAGATNFLPLTGFWGKVSFSIEGRPAPRPNEESSADNRVVTERYFRTMGIRLLRGREFDERDREGAAPVVIVNETMARRYWPNEDPVGARINLGQGNKPEIIGVVNDVKSFGLEEQTHPDIYRPFAQAQFRMIAFAVRTSGDPLGLVAAVKNAIYAVDKDQPVFKVITMEKLAAESITLRRVSMLLIGGLSALGLILAAIGVYGVMSYTISQQRREIGLRMALGAQANDVLKLVISQGMKPALVGMIIGLLASFALMRLIKNLLFGVSATDPATFVVISILLGGVALMACWVPARRATKVDPLVALRFE